MSHVVRQRSREILIQYLSVFHLYTDCSKANKWEDADVWFTYYQFRYLYILKSFRFRTIDDPRENGNFLDYFRLPQTINCTVMSTNMLHSTNISIQLIQAHGHFRVFDDEQADKVTGSTGDLHLKQFAKCPEKTMFWGCCPQYPVEGMPKLSKCMDFYKLIPMMKKNADGTGIFQQDLTKQFLLHESPRFAWDFT